MNTPRRIAIILATTLLGAALGACVGQPLAYAIADVVDRDIAELKGLLITLIIVTPVIAASAGFAIASVLTRSRARRFASWMFAVVAVLGGAWIVASYSPAKTSGTPVIDYELRMPAGIRADGIGNIDLTIWNGKNGQGCYISTIRNEGETRVISGSMTLSENNLEPRVSIAFHDGTRWTQGGVWTLQRDNRTVLEKAFGPWEAITFTAPVRDLPLAEGRFEIRYRLRSFM